MDRETILESVAKTGRLVIVDEAHKTGSVAAEIAAIVAEEGFSFLRAPIKRVASLDVPIPFSPPMEKFVVPTPDKVTSAVHEVLKAKA